jgi:phosphohistidine phosphatase SixA
MCRRPSRRAKRRSRGNVRGNETEVKSQKTRLARSAGAARLVGHEPDFSQAVALVTGSRVKMKKGGIAALDDHILHVLLRPKDLKQIAG